MQADTNYDESATTVEPPPMESVAVDEDLEKMTELGIAYLVDSCLSTLTHYSSCVCRTEMV